MKNKLQEYIEEHGLDSFKNLAYHYSKKFEHSCILDSCQLNTGVHGGNYEFLAAFGAKKVWTSYDEFSSQLDHNSDWLFGIFSYDLKNKFENLTSNNEAIIETPELLFFIPEILIGIDKSNQVELILGSISDDFGNPAIKTESRKVSQSNSSISKDIYLNKIADIHELIKAGEVYELNYCVPHSINYLSFDPIQFQLDLIKKSPVPMASYLKASHLHLCGASMERFIMKRGHKIISQPIKGTIKKGTSVEEDTLLISQLENSEKDRAENVMIVDLVRNDLNRVCKVGTVNVSELFGIYSYLQVHQMISTVEGELQNDRTLTNIIQSTYPMGSMTGAPKIASMKQIEKLENFKRGWYSGALGYVTPNNDFDFNVVIRSVLCDTNEKVLNYNAGGAITIDSNAESEWNEVQLKTKAITEVLSD